MTHLLSCRLLDEACTADDLVTVTERGKVGENCVKDTKEDRKAQKQNRPEWLILDPGHRCGHTYYNSLFQFALIEDVHQMRCLILR